MIVESENLVYVVESPNDNNEGDLVKAVRSEFTDEWLIFSENEYGELNIESITEMELHGRYGELPE
jgi:hypothetical protein